MRPWIRALFLTTLTIVAATLLGEETEPRDDVEMSLAFEAADAEVVKDLERYAVAGRKRIVDFFGLPFLAPFDFRVFPDRASFDGFFEAEWGIPETQCWWVAAGIGKGLIMLSPRVWATDACEHDGEDAAHVKGIVMHELVHVFHAQLNPGLEELEEIGWFIEGLATYVSGQLDDEDRIARLKAALDDGPLIERLEDGWSGPHRYGIAGTLVEVIDQRYGREVVKKLLRLDTEAEVLELLDVTENELLSMWRKHVTERGSG